MGLGQEKMAFCGPREDINSLMMTATSELLNRYGLKPSDIGRLEVGMFWFASITLTQKARNLLLTRASLAKRP